MLDPYDRHFAPEREREREIRGRDADAACQISRLRSPAVYWDEL
jgi:hypothetical protein